MCRSRGQPSDVQFAPGTKPFASCPNQSITAKPLEPEALEFTTVGSGALIRGYLRDGHEPLGLQWVGSERVGFEPTVWKNIDGGLAFCCEPVAYPGAVTGD
jgi:hypothetical protein